MKQRRKAVSIGLIIFVVIFTAAALIVILNTSESGPRDSQTIIGTWIEESTGLEVMFEKGNVFKIMGNDAAVYELDEENHIIRMTYAQAYGGQTVNESYTLMDNGLKLVNTETREEQNYRRKN